jgi:hypothetical protein
MKKITITAILGIFSILFISGCAPENSYTDSISYNWGSYDTVDNMISTETAQETSRLSELDENSGLSCI